MNKVCKVIIGFVLLIFLFCELKYHTWPTLRDLASPHLASHLRKESVSYSKEYLHSTYQEHDTQSDPEGVETKPTSLNRTVNSAKVLVYNRVPKCGSTTMLSLLRRLSANHNYSFVHSYEYHHFKMTAAEVSKLVDSLSDHKKPLVFDMHLFNPDWEKYGLQVNLINMVREPVDRFVSMFHFKRDYLVKKLVKKAKNENKAIDHYTSQLGWLNKTLERCVLRWDSECKGYELQMTFFCGPSEKCINSRSALMQAMHTVDTKYSVVGVTEDYRMSLRVLESYLPSWFGGATSMQENKNVHANVNPHNEPTQQVVEELKKRLALDIEFYKFVQRRLSLQMEKIAVTQT